MATYSPRFVFPSVPAFTMAGLLPPYCGADPSQQNLMAPYPTTVEVLAQQFSATPARRAILQGLLAFRQGLNQAGLCDGFQWLNGSFMEQVEVREGRDPGDIDVVTFHRRPPHVRADALWQVFFNSNAQLFQPVHNRSRFHCHAYFVDLDTDAAWLVAQARYWYGLFSHRRVTGEWKGLVEVPLALSQSDTTAAGLLGAATP